MRAVFEFLEPLISITCRVASVAFGTLSTTKHHRVTQKSRDARVARSHQCKPLAPGASVDSVQRRLCTTVDKFAAHHINRKVVYPLRRLRSPPIIRGAFRQR